MLKSNRIEKVCVNVLRYYLQCTKKFPTFYFFHKRHGGEYILDSAECPLGISPLGTIVHIAHHSCFAGATLFGSTVSTWKLKKFLPDDDQIKYEFTNLCKFWLM